jgi:hypothetical protein
MLQIFTEQEEIDRDLDLWESERNWRRNLPRHSDAEWLHIFPEAVSKWRPILIRRMKLERMFLEAHLADRKWDAVQALKTNKYPWRDDLIKDAARRDIAELERQIRAIDGRIAYMKTLGNKKVDSVQAKKNIITPDMVEQAKRYPIGDLVEVNRQGFSKCIWHTDTHASMFCKKNFAHCFVCQKSGDTIAIAMIKDGLSFKDAVLRLQ